MSNNRRPKIPEPFRSWLQSVVRYFVFIAIAWITLWNLYAAVTMFSQYGDVLKGWGFNSGRL